MDQNLEESLLVERSTIQDNVVDQLRILILNHYFKPNQRLRQAELAELLGVSRTPIREALVKLASEGLVTFSPYKGASVADFSVEDLNEIYAVRIGLESYAAYLAAERISAAQIDELDELLRKMRQAFNKEDLPTLLELNREFHTGIYSAAREKRLLDLINSYIDQAEVYRRIFVGLEHSREEMVKHQEILVALRAHDSRRAEERTRFHLRQTAFELTKFLESAEN